MALASVRIEPLFWNASNPIFSHETRGAEMNVRVGEKLDIYCPQSSNLEEPLFLKVFMVPEEGYETCTSAMRNAKKLFTCDQPDQEKKYTLLFQEVNPNPFGLEFQRGQNYFLVSTADGTPNGINNLEGGVCEMFNMRIKLAVSEAYEDEEILITSTSLNTEKLKREMIPWERQKEAELEDEINRVVNEEVEFVATSGFTIGIIIGAFTVLLLIVFAVVGYKWWTARGDIRKATYIHRPKNHQDPTSEVHLTLVPAGTHYPFGTRATTGTRPVQPAPFGQGNIYNPIYKKESPSNTFNSRQESLGENSCGSEMTYLAPADGGVVEV